MKTHFKSVFRIFSNQVYFPCVSFNFLPSICKAVCNVTACIECIAVFFSRTKVEFPRSQQCWSHLQEFYCHVIFTAETAWLSRKDSTELEASSASPLAVGTYIIHHTVAAIWVHSLHTGCPFLCHICFPSQVKKLDCSLALLSRAFYFLCWICFLNVYIQIIFSCRKTL